MTIVYEGVSLGTLLVFLVSFCLAVIWIRSPRNLPPGPIGIPLLGYLPFIVLRSYRTGVEPHELLTQMARQYGKMYSFTVIGITIVAISDYELLKEALQNRHLNDRSTNEFSTKVFGTVETKFKNFYPYRKFALSRFRSYGFGNSNFEDIVSTEVSILTDMLRKNHTALDPKELLQTATTNIICAVVIGKRYEYSDDRFIHLLDMIDKWNDRLGAGLIELFLPILKHIPTQAKAGLRECADAIIPFVENVIAEHKEQFDPTNPKDFIDAYLNEQVKSGKQAEGAHWLTTPNMRGNMYALFAAGGDTTSSVLGWCIVYLVNDRALQDKLHGEMDKCIGRDRLPRLTDKENLPFCRAFLLEILRVTSVVPLGILHAAAESVELDGYTIPKGSSIVPNIWAINNDPNVWTDPECFRPERFIDEKGEFREYHPVITFSIGRRSCPGEALAKTMLYTAFTHLLHTFTFALPDGAQPIPLKGKLGIVYKPVPYKVQLINRY